MQKFIKVLIQEAVGQSMSGSDFPCRRCDIITPQSENATVNVAKPLPWPPLTEMEIKNKNIVFPKTRTGQSSGKSAYLLNIASVVSCVQRLFLLYCMFGNFSALTLLLFP